MGWLFPSGSPWFLTEVSLAGPSRFSPVSYLLHPREAEHVAAEHGGRRCRNLGLVIGYTCPRGLDRAAGLVKSACSRRSRVQRSRAPDTRASATQCASLERHTASLTTTASSLSTTESSTSRARPALNHVATWCAASLTRRSSRRCLEPPYTNRPLPSSIHRTTGTKGPCCFVVKNSDRAARIYNHAHSKPPAVVGVPPAERTFGTHAAGS